MKSIRLLLESSPLTALLSSLFLERSEAPLRKCQFPKDIVFCQGENLVKLPQCRLGPVEDGNLRSYFILERLLHEPFFRYFKVDLKKKCPYWDSVMSCFSDQCAIDFLHEEPEIIPKAQPLLTGEADTLNDVKFPKFQQVHQ